MSRDIAIDWPCPHTVGAERVELSPDRTSLVTAQPIASANSVLVTANDVAIPSTGLALPATLCSAIAGPYELTPTTNTLVIKTARQEQTFVLPVTSVSRWTTDQVCKALLRQNLEFLYPESVNGALAFIDLMDTGTQSEIHVSGSAATSLGFSTQWGSTGKVVYPPWSIVAQDERRYPVFQTPISGSPVFRVTYNTNVQQCRRCRTTGQENDYNFAPSGDVYLVQDEDLLYQAAVKIVITRINSNPFHPWYGTSLWSRIGTKVLGSIANQISEDVRLALGRMQKQQNAQSKYQPISYKERLYSIESVNTRQDAEDPSLFFVDVVVKNAVGTVTNLNLAFANS